MNSKNKTTTDLIDSVCKDVNNRFGGVPCQSFSPIDRDCRLLRDAKMKEFWDNCRIGNFQTLYFLIDKYLKQFKNQFGNIGTDDKEDIDYKEIIDGLTKSKPEKGQNLVVWLGYLKKAARWKVWRIFADRGLIPEKKRCGACVHLSNEKMCMQFDKSVKKTDKPCNDYKPRIPDIISIDDPEVSFIETEDEPIESISGNIKEKVFDYQKKLEQRIEISKKGSAERRRFERQYDIFINLLHLFREDIDLSDAVKIQAKKSGLNPRTIYRDIQEIKEFLEKLS